jgi:acetoacetate decarboxylase
MSRGFGARGDSALHFRADLTLGLGTVAFDYLAK